MTDIKKHSRTISGRNNREQSGQRREPCLIRFVSTIIYKQQHSAFNKSRQTK